MFDGLLRLILDRKIIVVFGLLFLVIYEVLWFSENFVLFDCVFSFFSNVFVWFIGLYINSFLCNLNQVVCDLKVVFLFKGMVFCSFCLIID